MIFSIPLWTIMAVVLAVFMLLGIMQWIRAKRKVKQRFIEREGQVFMERMAYEKRRKQSM